MCYDVANGVGRSQGINMYYWSGLSHALALDYLAGEAQAVINQSINQPIRLIALLRLNVLMLGNNWAICPIKAHCQSIKQLRRLYDPA